MLLRPTAASAGSQRRAALRHGFQSVAFADAERALAVGDGGPVLLSTDGGETWQPKTSGTTGRALVGRLRERRARGGGR